MSDGEKLPQLSQAEAAELVARLQSTVPTAMRERKQWLLWRFEPGAKKPRKVPCYVSGRRRGGTQGSDADRAELATFDAVLEALRQGRWAGVGYAFLPDDGLIGIDIDGQLGNDGAMSPRAAQIIEACASYTEYSPSRRGVHIIVRGHTETFKSDDIGLEVYCGAQFFTVTGEPFPGTPPDVVSIADETLDRMRAMVAAAKAARAPAPPVREKAPAAATAPAGANDFATVNAAAMANLQGWVTDVFPSAKVYHRGYRVTSRSLGRDLEEDISIVPDGIVDFGVKETDANEGRRSPIDLVMEWSQHRTAVDAMKYLAGLLGVRLSAPPVGRKAKARNEPLAQGAEAPPPIPDDRDEAPAEDAPLLKKGDRRLRKTEEGAPKNTPANIDLILRYDPEWRGVLAYDEFSYRIIKLRPPPFPGGTAGPWEETDATKAGVWIERKWGIAAKSITVHEIARAVAWDARYHCVMAWLRSLPPWDGTPRLHTFLADAFGVEQSEYSAHVGTGLVVTAVARVKRPGCKVDTMVVLEGLQGIGKSTAVVELFSGAWYVDIIDPPSHKDFYITLQGNWVVEIGEMQSFTRSEVNQVKQAITRRDDKFRAPYDKAASEHPRQSIFIGTTNADTYLMDPSGGRRFLPVKCTKADVGYVRAVREQLFAEAIVKLKAGFRWWEFPAEQAQSEQDQRYVEDSWVEPVEAWLNGKVSSTQYPEDMELSYDSGSKVPRPNSVTTTQVMRHALSIELAKHTRQDQMRLGQIMRRLGWTQAPLQRVKGSPHTRIRPWVRPAAPVEPPPDTEDVPI